MTRKEYETRVNRLAHIACGIAFAMLAWYVAAILYALYPMVKSGLLRETSAAVLLSSALVLAGTIVIVVLALRLVLSLRKETTPFTVRNADRLRVIGWLLIGYELTLALISRISGGMAIEGETGVMISVQSHTSLGGLLITVGLAVLAISYVFRYGIELQQLSDETL